MRDTLFRIKTCYISSPGLIRAHQVAAGRWDEFSGRLHPNGRVPMVRKKGIEQLRQADIIYARGHLVYWSINFLSMMSLRRAGNCLNRPLKRGSCNIQQGGGIMWFTGHMSPVQYMTVQLRFESHHCWGGFGGTWNDSPLAMSIGFIIFEIKLRIVSISETSRLGGIDRKLCIPMFYLGRRKGQKRP